MADISFAEHPLEFQIADRLVRAWISEQHGYLKDGGGSQGMHRVPRDALIAAIANAFGPYVTVKPMPRPVPVKLDPPTEADVIAAMEPGDVADPAPKRKPRQKKVAE